MSAFLGRFWIPFFRLQQPWIAMHSRVQSWLRQIMNKKRYFFPFSKFDDEL